VLTRAQRVIVIEKSLAVGLGGIVSTDVRMALSGLHLHGYTVIGGLGGRPILKSSLHRLFEQAIRDELEHVTFLDLNWDVVNRVLEREKATRRSGSIAENILRDLGVAASGVG